MIISRLYLHVTNTRKLSIYKQIRLLVFQRQAKHSYITAGIDVHLFSLPLSHCHYQYSKRVNFQILTSSL